MKIILRLSQIGILLAILAFIATFPVRANYAGRAQLSVRIERNNSDSLFGSAGTPLGDAQLYIVDDPKAYLEGEGMNKSKLLDENYLKAHKIYPLQLQTVDFFVAYTRYGSLAATLTFLVILYWSRSRPSRRNATG